MIYTKPVTLEQFDIANIGEWADVILGPRDELVRVKVIGPVLEDSWQYRNKRASEHPASCVATTYLVECVVPGQGRTKIAVERFPAHVAVSVPDEPEPQMTFPAVAELEPLCDEDLAFAKRLHWRFKIDLMTVARRLGMEVARVKLALIRAANREAA